MRWSWKDGHGVYIPTPCEGLCEAIEVQALKVGVERCYASNRTDEKDDF